MAEVPQHLLDRAKARRAAMGQGGGEAAPAAPAGSATDAPAAPATPAVVPAATAAPGPKAAPAVAAAPPPPRGMQVAKIGRVALMATVPVWAFFFAGTFVTPKAAVESEAARGARLYQTNCASCHLANGAGKDAGGVGRALWKGEAVKTFPDLAAQIAFVRHGSCAKDVGYGDPKREGGQHKSLTGMPAFPAESLSDADLEAIVKHERSVLSEEEYPTTVPGETVPTTLAPTTENVCGTA